MQSVVTLRVTRVNQVPRTIEFHSPQIVVFGRERSCDARIGLDPYASRHHFIMEVSPPDVRIRDLGSSNGTYVNRRRIASDAGGEVELRDGDVIRAGRTTITLGITSRGGTEPTTRRAPGPPTPDAALPERIGRYRVQEVLGRGTYGVVYRALAPEGRDVAVKVLASSTAANLQVQRRFLREIETLQDLDHPNILRYEHADTEHDRLHLVTQYCNAGSAEDLLNANREGVAPEVLTPLLLDVARGLGHAHRAGLVHRDVKPANLLLHTVGGRTTARIADFGLTKSLEKVGVVTLTMTGATGGTLGYMPREQLLDFKRVSPASDVWSLGATAYHLLTGHRPRPHTRGGDPFKMVLERDVTPLWKHLPDAPAPLVLAITRALAPAPADRYRDAAELAAALERAL